MVENRTAAVERRLSLALAQWQQERDLRLLRRELLQLLGSPERHSLAIVDGVSPSAIGVKRHGARLPLVALC